MMFKVAGGPWQCDDQRRSLPHTPGTVVPVPQVEKSGKKGENGVFPIQVSRRRYSYFSRIVIFISIDKNTDCLGCQSKVAPTCHKTPFRLAATAAAMNEGEEIFPIQVHSETRYCYCGAVIVIQAAAGVAARCVPHT
jgi:hypothetical protein